MKSHPEILTEPEIINSFFIEKFEKSPGNVEIPTRLSYHKILLIESGTGKISIDHQSFDVLENEVFLMSKGQIYSFENQSNISGFSLSFGGCFWEKTPQSASNCKAVLFDNASANQLLNLDDDETGDL